MCNKTCGNRCIAELIISILAGVVIGILFFNGLIAGITAAIITALILTGVAILTLAILSTDCKESFCVCKYGKCGTPLQAYFGGRTGRVGNGSVSQSGKSRRRKSI